MKRYLQIEGSDAKGIADVVDALARLFQGKAECRQVLVVKTDSDALADGLKALFPGKVGEVEVHGEVKRLEAKSPQPPSISPQMNNTFGGSTSSEREEKRKKLEARYCRNCLAKYQPRREDAKCCSPKCSGQYGVRKVQMRSKNGMQIEAMYFHRSAEGKLLYMSEVEFRNRLKEGFFAEGAQVLSPEGWLLTVRMAGGEWTFDERRTG